MKYIKAYIKKICPTVTENDSFTMSHSKYFNLNDIMTIRLSDHYAITTEQCDLNIVQSYDKDKFVITCKDIGIPMVRNRREVNAFIKNHFEYRHMRSMCIVSQKEAKKKRDKSTFDELTFEKKKSYYHPKVLKAYKLHTNTIMYGKYTSVFSIVCCSGLGISGKTFTKTMKAQFKKLFDDGLRGVEFVEFIYRQKGLALDEILDNIIKIEKEYKLKED